MLGNAIGPELIELIEAREFDALREVLSDLAPSDLAEIIEDMDPETGAIIFRVLPKVHGGETFGCLSHELQERLLKSMSNDHLAALLNEMTPDDRTAFFEELPGEVTKQLITLLNPQERQIALKLLGYPEGSVGRLMTPDYVAAKADWTVERTIDHVRVEAPRSETVNVVYVVDDHGQLLDDLRLREVIQASPGSTLGDLCDYTFVSLGTNTDREEAVRLFRKYYRIALPVIDSQGILVGIVTIDDILDVAEEEATEDMQKMGGSEALGEPYLKIGMPTMVRKRVVWLIMLFVGGTFTATAIAAFEEDLKKASVLAVFLPLIIASGGNSGSQASSLVIRAMALGEVSLGDWFQVLKRELLSGLVLGLILGIVGFARVALGEVTFGSYGEHFVRIGLTILCALVGVVLWGTLVGGLLPLALRRIGLDPAVSSAPFVATLVDVVGIIIYLGVASFMLKGALL